MARCHGVGFPCGPSIASGAESPRWATLTEGPSGPRLTDGLGFADRESGAFYPTDHFRRESGTRL